MVLGMCMFFNACLYALDNGWGRKGLCNWHPVCYKVHASKEIGRWWTPISKLPTNSSSVVSTISTLVCVLSNIFKTYFKKYVNEIVIFISFRNSPFHWTNQVLLSLPVKLFPYTIEVTSMNSAWLTGLSPNSTIF